MPSRSGRRKNSASGTTTGESQIQVDGVHLGELKVNAIEYILFIALGVHDGKLGRIEETAAVQAVGRDEISPFLASAREVKPCIGGAETTVGSADGAMG